MQPSGFVVLELEPVNCQSVVNEVATGLRPLIEAKGLTFDVILPKENVVVSTDRRALSAARLVAADRERNWIESADASRQRLQPDAAQSA